MIRMASRQFSNTCAAMVSVRSVDLRSEMSRITAYDRCSWSIATDVSTTSAQNGSPAPVWYSHS